MDEIAQREDIDSELRGLLFEIQHFDGLILRSGFHGIGPVCGRPGSKSSSSLYGLLLVWPMYLT